jgi:MFS family permease
MLDVRPHVATAPLAAAGLIAGYAVALATGSRPLGGVVLATFGLACIATWLRRDGRRTATLLTIAGLLAFALSHVIGLIIGSWPAVLLAAAVAGMLSWQLSDSRHMKRKRLPAGIRTGS